MPKTGRGLLTLGIKSRAIREIHRDRVQSLNFDLTADKCTMSNLILLSKMTHILTDCHPDKKL